MADKSPGEAGLSIAEAARRLVDDGPNALPGGQRRTLIAIIGETVREPMFLLLLALTFDGLDGLQSSRHATQSDRSLSVRHASQLTRLV